MNTLVSAGAGSGKTYVLTKRVISLLTDEKNPVDIDRLFVATFTVSATAEMKERIRKAINDEIKKIRKEKGKKLFIRNETTFSNCTGNYGKSGHPHFG